jgi:hypothetical protein
LLTGVADTLCVLEARDCLVLALLVAFLRL